MARLNRLNFNMSPESRPHEGGLAAVPTAEAALRHTVLASHQKENQFDKDGATLEQRVAALVPQVEATAVAALAIEARERLHLRHMPLLLVREMAPHACHRPLVAVTLVRVIQRADELAEFVAIYGKEGKQPLSAQVKKGLAAAFAKFDGYQLAKYDRAASARRAHSLPRASAGDDSGGVVESACRRQAAWAEYPGAAPFCR